MICPILKRFATDPTCRTDCPFEAQRLCTDSPNMVRCYWADWHMLDPITGKPREPAPKSQGDLFR